jgi:methionyl-tRNA formyltransferase
MAGRLSRAPLLALLEADIAVRAVVIPSPMRLAGGASSPDEAPIALRSPTRSGSGRARELPLLGGAVADNIIQIAATHGIPVLAVSRLRDPQTLATLAAYTPDAICVACFPWRVPRAILNLPRIGCLNLHPSLLPESRGPDPLFWTFRRGDGQTGVTVHLMDERLDAGPILAQQALLVADGATETELERRCGEVGGELLVRALLELTRGVARAQPQDETRATYHPWPQETDYVISPERPARWAHNFVRGVGARSMPIHVVVAGRAFRVLASLGYEEGVSMPDPWRLEGDHLQVRCSAGIWRARVVVK